LIGIPIGLTNAIVVAMLLGKSGGTALGFIAKVISLFNLLLHIR
jgi:hypothetical protein